MATYFTPGSYIEEISKLPASVAPVATAIPAFIGYTQKNDSDGTTPPTPVRITSMLDYEEKFGGPFPEFFEVTLTDDDISTSGSTSPYVLYYQVQMYFANGGGPCYIVSVGAYGIPDHDPLPDNPPDATSISDSALLDGLEACEKEDEITLLCIPEAIFLSNPGQRATINDAMLSHCALLQDRFAIMDVLTNDNIPVFDEGQNFRNKDVSLEALKYGAAYYPSLKTSMEYGYLDEAIKIVDNRTFPIYTTGTVNERLSSILSGKTFELPLEDLGEKAVFKITLVGISAGDQIVINGTTFEAVTATGTPPSGIIEFEIGASDDDAAAALESALPADLFDNLSTSYTVTSTTNTVTIAANSIGSIGNGLRISLSEGTPGSIVVTPEPGIDGINKNLYNQIKKELSKNKLTLYPCGAIAGVYARIDRNRGVWKAPANTSVNRIIAPSRLVTSEEQESLNIDATSGKSINAIRTFAGKGTLVWGARTLAGNDNEWRYVPVRRLFIFMEESIKKATEFVVFEPNNANTWNRTKGMIENFLTGLWREGALAGAAPDEAFFVNVGLGVTMTAQEILEGIMNVEIGVAAVRPAEFIILKFSHKLQES